MSRSISYGEKSSRPRIGCRVPSSVEIPVCPYVRIPMGPRNKRALAAVDACSEYGSVAELAVAHSVIDIAGYVRTVQPLSQAVIYLKFCRVTGVNGIVEKVEKT